MADWTWVPFGVVSAVGREMGVLDGADIVNGKGQFEGECRPYQWDSLREGQQCSSSQITLYDFLFCMHRNDRQSASSTKSGVL